MSALVYILCTRQFFNFIRLRGSDDLRHPILLTQNGGLASGVTSSPNKIKKLSYTEVYIALGANLADPKATLQTAIARLAQLPNTHLLQQSSLYQTSPLGPANQPDFINAVVLVKTALSPLSLLDALQALERELGRVPTERWGPRMIDLDILLYGDQVINSDRLTLPHPGIYHREFVLYPLAEIAPDWVLPTGQTVSQLKASCDPRGIKPCQP